MENESSAHGALDTNVIRVMMIDDHELVRRGLKTIIRKTPKITLVGEAASGNEALEKIEKLNPDIVLVDIKLPDMDGFAVAREAMEKHPDARIIMLSGYDSMLYVSEALNLKVWGFIPKHCSRELMISSIKAVANGSTVWGAKSFFDSLKHLSRMSGIGRQSGNETFPREQFTQRELKILKLIAEGKTNQQIALFFELTQDAIKKAVSKILVKIGVSSRMEAAVYASQHGLI